MRAFSVTLHSLALAQGVSVSTKLSLFDKDDGPVNVEELPVCSMLGLKAQAFRWGQQAGDLEPLSILSLETGCNLE